MNTVAKQNYTLTREDCRRNTVRFKCYLEIKPRYATSWLIVPPHLTSVPALPGQRDTYENFIFSITLESSYSRSHIFLITLLPTQNFRLVVSCGGATVSSLDLRSTGPGFKSYGTRGKSCVATLRKLFTPMCLCHQAV